MSANYWAKLWIETLDDPKVARLPDSSWRRFFECVMLAKELDQGGYLPPVADMAWRLRLSETTMSDDMSRLALAGLVELSTYEGEERWFITNFHKRQSKVSDAERQKAWRERQKRKPRNDDDDSGGGISDVRITNSIHNRYAKVTKSYANVTPETETETETEAEEEGRGNPPAAVHYGQFDRTPGPNGKGYNLPAEPPVSPPAVQLMQRLTGRYPGAGNIDYIAGRLGESPDEAALTAVVKAWRARGYNMGNYEGMCDWYDERKVNPRWTPPKIGGGARVQASAAPLVKMQEVAPGLF